jgi:pilus assembly protein Flp/PilA
MQYLSSLFGRVSKKGIGRTVVWRLIESESGVTAIEYAFIASLIAVAGVTAMGTIGTHLTTTFSKVASSL